MTVGPRVALIDYGVVNVDAIARALIDSGASVKIAYTGSDISESEDVLVLPGVGSWEQGVNELLRLQFISKISEQLNKGKKVFGICLGFQLLASSSEEGFSPGLGLIPSKIRRISSFDTTLRPVNNGWSKLQVSVDSSDNNSLTENLRDRKFYFTHSFGLKLDPHIVTSNVLTIQSIGNSNVVGYYLSTAFGGVQFHPERSHLNGINFFRELWKIW